MDRAELERLQLSKLAAGLERVLSSNRFYQQKFAETDVAASGVRSLLDLARLPFTTKSDLTADQADHPPYGSNLTYSLERYVRMHQSSGTSSGQPLRWLDDRESWRWVLDCWQEIYEAIGLEQRDRLFFAFSFGPFLGFWAAFDGANRFGCYTLAGGGASSIARLKMIIDNQITFVLCTPTYALRLAETAAEQKIDLAGSSVRGLILAGEPGASIPATRERIERAWGARAFDHSGMTEIGSLGIEYAELPGKLFMLEDQAIFEFLDPRTQQPVPAGELGELVITNLGRWGSPLIRYRTGDIVRWRDDVSPAGKPYRYLEGGILSRLDDMLWVKGNNVYPGAIEGIVRGIPEIEEFLLEVAEETTGQSLTIAIETIPSCDSAAICDRLSQTIQNRHSFKPTLRLAPPGTLPRSEMKSQRVVRKPG